MASNDPVWLVLYTRYGAARRAPSPQQLAAAVHELFAEEHGALVEADYEEHGESSLTCGRDGGPVYILSLSRRGTARLETWQDADLEVALRPPMVLPCRAEADGQALWTTLAQGRIEEILALPWTNADAFGRSDES